MILSHDELPLSLLFNTGRRKDSAAYHYNRWIPDEVSQDTLSSKPIMQRPRQQDPDQRYSFLTLKSSESAFASSNISIILVWQVIPQAGAYNLIVEENFTYHVEPILDANDSFDMTTFSSTCIIIEKERNCAYETLRGACLYFAGMEKREDITAGKAGLDLVFCCPLRIKKALGMQDSQVQPFALYKGQEMRPDCEARIRTAIDPSLDFQNLKQEGYHTMPVFTRARIEIAYSIMLLAGFGISVAFLVSALFETSLTNSKSRPSSSLTIGVPVLVIFMAIIITGIMFTAIILLIVYTRTWPCSLIDYLVYYKSFDDNSWAQKIHRGLIRCWSFGLRLSRWLWNRLFGGIAKRHPVPMQEGIAAEDKV